jgi:hypothetical protein
VLLKRTSSAAGTLRRNVGVVLHTNLVAGVAMVMMTCAAMSDELKGHKGSIAIGIDKRQREKSHVK